MSSLAARMRADARLSILQILSEDLGYSVNHSILRDAVDIATAITMTDDDIVAHLGWLENEKLVTTEVRGPYTLAKLTDAGLAVAKGRSVREGVSRPLPDHV